MSRLTQNPFLQPSGLGGLSPFAGNPFLRSAMQGPSVNDLLPEVDPEEQKSYLSKAMEEGLGGLAYLGKLADKTFGGRAVRGALGGNARELASILPLSDTLGITNESDTVSGRTLLENTGLLGKDEDPQSFGWGDAAGLAAEVTLDPSTYLGLGPLTKGAGTLAKKAGALPKGFRSQAAGYAARESDLEKLIGTLPVEQQLGMKPADVLRQERITGDILPKSLEAEATKQGIGLEPQHVFDPVTGGLIPNQAGATPLASLARFKLPFLSPELRFGTGETGLKALDFATDNALSRTLFDNKLGRAASAGLGAAGRTFNQGFEKQVLDAGTAEGQAAARGQSARLDAFGRETTGRKVDLEDAMRPLATPEGNTPWDAANRDAVIGSTELPVDYYTKLVPDGLDNKGSPLYRRVIDPAIAGSIAQPEFLSRFVAGQVNPIMSPQVADSVEAASQLYRKTLSDAHTREAAGGAVANPLLHSDNVLYSTRALQDYPEALAGPPSPFDAVGRGSLGGFSANNPSMTARKEALDLPGGTLQVNKLLADPKWSGTGRTTPESQRLAEFRAIFAGRANPTQVQTAAGKFTTDPAYDLARQLDEITGNVPQEAVDKGVNFFSTDIPSLAKLRSSRADRTAATAETLLDAAANNALPAGSIPGGVKLSEMFTRFGLDGKVGGDFAAPIMVANKMGLPNANGVGDMVIDPALAADLIGMNTRGPLLPDGKLPRAWNWAKRLTKSSLTSPFPGFHTRNATGGTYDAMLSGVNPVEFAKSAYRADQFMKGKGLKSTLGITDDEFRRELAQAGLLDSSTGQNLDALGNAGETVAERTRGPVPTDKSTARQIFDAYKGGLRDTFKKPASIEEFGPIRGGREVGQIVEDRLRIGNYLALREQGFTKEAATAQVNKYQRDYSNLSRFERAVPANVLPFYGFSRRTLPALADTLAEAPSKITAPLRAATGARTKGEFVPPYVAEESSIPIPGAPEGSQRYVSSFGLPFEDSFVKSLGALAHGDLTRALSSTLGTSLPWIKAPLEATFDTSLFSGRPLEEMKPYSWSGLGGLLNDKQARLLTESVANTPFSRVASSVDKLIDDRKGPIPKAVNLLSGFRISDVDAERAKLAASKKFLAEELRGQPGVKTASETYVPKSNIPALSGDDAVRYRIMLELDQKLRDLARQRKEMGL